MYACLLGFCHTLEIITRTLCEVVNRVRLCGHHTRRRSRLFACLRGFSRTLEIITRTLREVVNRVRLCGYHTHRSSRGEVHMDGAVMRRGGEGGDWYCIDSVLKTRVKRPTNSFKYHDIKSPWFACLIVCWNFITL